MAFTRKKDGSTIGPDTLKGIKKVCKTMLVVIEITEPEMI
jgi:hypothetical protein